jgi:RND family efflux transporter MFP subunit
LIAVLVGGAACGGPAPDSAPAAPPPVPVQLATVEARPVDRSSDFLATVQTLSSSTVQPEVEGVVTRVFVRSGDRVARGTPLVQISADRQAAAVRSAEANREGTEADVRYWQQQVERFKSLLEAGAISRQEFDQAQTSLDTARARLGALDAQVREGNVQLQYYRVVARQAGMVGDIPVRVGDRVTTGTVITTIDASEDLEAHIQVPLDRSPDLQTGLQVQLLDARGAIVATNPVSFIAPRVDDETQTVLVKSRLRDMPASTRVRQFVRARIIWSTESAVTAPVTAVTRISGQYFAFVAEAGPQGGLVARQKPVEVGEVVGNDYVIERGLSAGDRLVVSGIQKIGDGAPIQQEPS